MKRKSARPQKRPKPSSKGLRASLEVLHVVLALKRGLPDHAKRRLASRDA